MSPARARAATPDPDHGEITLTERDFRVIAELAKGEYGLHLESSKKPLIRSRLSRRIRALGLDTFSAYCEIVAQGNAAERDHFLTALTTNVTHFYREKHHFETLEGELLPALREKAQRGGRVRLWSAGCSTGQEPYSMAGSVLKIFPEASTWDVRILATDVDPNVLRKAEAGTYALEDCQFPSDDWRQRVFARAKPGQAQMEVRSELRELIAFRRLNLIAAWPISGRFDAIFCRNVAIYFDKDTQERLWARFAEALHPGAYLFIGHSERIGGAALAAFESAGITTYRRRSAETPRAMRNWKGV